MSESKNESQQESQTPEEIQADIEDLRVAETPSFDAEDDAEVQHPPGDDGPPQLVRLLGDRSHAELGRALGR